MKWCEVDEHTVIGIWLPTDLN